MPLLILTLIICGLGWEHMANNNNYVIQTTDLTKRFGGLVAVNKVSMNVTEGEIMGLIGPNGAGKTTLLNAIAGLNNATSGVVHFLGEDTTTCSPEEMCHKGLSRTFQIPIPFPKLSVLDNVMVAAVFGNDPRLKDPVKHAREQLSFVEFALPEDMPSEKLNTVQLKRLDLARALASEPKVMLLDELASGLTERELEPLMKIILKIRDKGITILMVEHIMDVIMGLCQQLAVINFGNKIAEGPTKEVSRDPKVVEAYLGVEED